MYTQAATGLPYPINTWDESTINPNLPSGNEFFPALNRPGQILTPDQLALAVSDFRTRVQQGLNYQHGYQPDPLAVFFYNVVSQNRFENDTYRFYCQLLVDFIAYLMINQNDHYQAALSKAGGRIYAGALAITLGQYPALGQYLNQQDVAQHQQAGQEIAAISQDVQAFVSNGYRPLYQQQQQQPMYAQPMQPAPGYGHPPTMGHPGQYGGQGLARPNAAVTPGQGNYAVQPLATPPPAVQRAPTMGVNTSGGQGRYVVDQVRQQTLRSDEMLYPQHELNPELKNQATPSEGKLVGPYSDLTPPTPPPPPPANFNQEEQLDLKAESEPKLVGAVVSGSTQLEAETEAIHILEEQGDYQWNPEQPEPPSFAYEYRTVKSYPLLLSRKAEEALLEVAEQSLAQAAARLEELYSDGDIVERYYLFLDKRMAQGINLALARNLSVPNITIDSFTGDYQDLLDHLANTGRKLTAERLEEHAAELLTRYLKIAYEQLEDGDTGQASVLDEYWNLQMTVDSDDVSHLITDDQVLITSVTHPKTYQVITKALARHKDDEGVGLRLLTADGLSLEVTEAWLSKNTYILYRV